MVEIATPGSRVNKLVDLAVVEAFARRAERLREICFREYGEGEGWRRAVDLGTTLNGLTLTGLPDRIRKNLDHQLAQMNPILGKYTINTFEDYRQISEEDQEQIRKIFLGACELVPHRYRSW
jgi:hypothetical protein